MTPSLFVSDWTTGIGPTILIWVSDHKGIPSDEAADDLAKAAITATTTHLTCHHESPYPANHHRLPAQQAANGHSLWKHLLAGTLHIAVQGAHPSLDP